MGRAASKLEKPDNSSSNNIQANEQEEEEEAKGNHGATDELERFEAGNCRLDEDCPKGTNSRNLTPATTFIHCDCFRACHFAAQDRLGSKDVDDDDDGGSMGIKKEHCTSERCHIDALNIDDELDCHQCSGGLVSCSCCYADCVPSMMELEAQPTASATNELLLIKAEQPNISICSMNDYSRTNQRIKLSRHRSRVRSGKGNSEYDLHHSRGESVTTDSNNHYERRRLTEKAEDSSGLMDSIPLTTTMTRTRTTTTTTDSMNAPVRHAKELPLRKVRRVSQMNNSNSSNDDNNDSYVEKIKAIAFGGFEPSFCGQKSTVATLVSQKSRLNLSNNQQNRRLSNKLDKKTSEEALAASRLASASSRSAKGAEGDRGAAAAFELDQCKLDSIEEEKTTGIEHKTHLVDCLSSDNNLKGLNIQDEVSLFNSKLKNCKTTYREQEKQQESIIRKRLEEANKATGETCKDKPNLEDNKYFNPQPKSNTDYISSQTTSNNNYDYLNWKSITEKYHKMPRHQTSSSSTSEQLCWRLRSSCFCNLIINSIYKFFPILSSFKNYNLPGDLITDLIAGSTVAILHIPQGMAYGLLAGVEPIHGLYVSFVPVIVMALMSKSRHVSYGTFAILSMLMANACDLVKLSLINNNNNELIGVGGTGSALSQDIANSLVNKQGPITNIITVPDELLPNNDNLPNEQPINTNNNKNFINSVASAAGEILEASQIQQALIKPLLQTTVKKSPGDIDYFASSGSIELPTNIEILSCICILVGCIQIAMAVLKLGILSLMFSDQLVSSFTAASAFHVVTSQLPNLFDLAPPSVPNGLFKVCRAWWALTQLLLDGFNQYTALLSLSSIVFLLTVKEFIEPLIRKRLFKSLTCLPSELILMAFIITSSSYWKFEQTLGIEIIGHVPTELPSPKVPRLDIVQLVFQDSVTIALVSFAMNLSLGQVYAKRNKYQLDPNQELFALGTSNVVGSFFSCFPCASSLSRSAVQSNLNVKSQICSLFSSIIVILIITYFAPILHDLPRSTLSCIIVVALKGILFQVKDLYENWCLSKLDAIVWITTFMSVLAFGVTYGLVLGIAASLFMVFVRLLNPNHSILGQLPGTEIYVDKSAFMDCDEIDQVKIFRFNSALCYLNRTMFKSCIEKSLPIIYKRESLFYANDKECDIIHGQEKIKFLIIDCSALAYCDYSGAETLVDIVDELKEHKVHVHLAACPVKLIDMLEKMKKTHILEQNVYPTITDAINHAKYLRRGCQLKPKSSLTNDLPDGTDGDCLHTIVTSDN